MHFELEIAAHCESLIASTKRMDIYLKLVLCCMEDGL